jgi:type I restriction enzyme R subunit
VSQKFGEKYGGMTLNDWRHIIEEYTPMIRANVKDFASEEKAKSIQMNYPMAAEE